eukprot:1183813-Prorocentrum_minimum.AAC.1
MSDDEGTSGNWRAENLLEGIEHLEEDSSTKLNSSSRAASCSWLAGMADDDDDDDDEWRHSRRCVPCTLHSTTPAAHSPSPRVAKHALNRAACSQTRTEPRRM